MAPGRPRKTIQNRSKTGQERQHRPKSGQERSKTTQDRSKIAPRSLKIAQQASTSPQEAPRSLLDRPWLLQDASNTIAESSKTSPRLLRSPSNLPCVIAYVFSECNTIQRISHTPSGDRSWLGLQNVLKTTSMPWIALGMFSYASASDKDRSKRIQDRSKRSQDPPKLALDRAMKPKDAPKIDFGPI